MPRKPFLTTGSFGRVRAAPTIPTTQVSRWFNLPFLCPFEKAELANAELHRSVSGSSKKLPLFAIRRCPNSNRRQAPHHADSAEADRVTVARGFELGRQTAAGAGRRPGSAPCDGVRLVCCVRLISEGSMSASTASGAPESTGAPELSEARRPLPPPPDAARRAGAGARPAAPWRPLRELGRKALGQTIEENVIVSLVSAGGSLDGGGRGLRCYLFTLKAVFGQKEFKAIWAKIFFKAILGQVFLKLIWAKKSSNFLFGLRPSTACLSLNEAASEHSTCIVGQQFLELKAVKPLLISNQCCCSLFRTIHIKSSGGYIISIFCIHIAWQKPISNSIILWKTLYGHVFLTKTSWHSKTSKHA